MTIFQLGKQKFVNLQKQDGEVYVGFSDGKRFYRRKIGQNGLEVSTSVGYHDESVVLGDGKRLIRQRSKITII